MGIRSIRPLAPSVCPQCGGEKTFMISKEKVECQRCGYVMRDADQKPVPPVTASKPVQRDLSQYRASYRITHFGGVEPFVEAAYTTAMDMVGRQNWEEAIKALRRCVDYRSDFTDAHLWLGRLLDDPVERRDHLTTVLAHEPTHPEALRDLLILDGELQPTGERFDEYTMPEVREANAAVNTKLQNVRCPRCGSPNLTDDDARGVVYCTSCGYTEDQQKQIEKINSLAAALIKRRSQPVLWIVGERWLQCRSCGSTRTIPQRQLAETCPFCGSKNVIEQDALNTFQQPEGLIPFAITAKQAMERVEAQLKSLGERFKGFFNNNRVKRSQIEGVFLPFWVFDAVVDVQRTTIDTRGNIDRRRGQVSTYQTEQLAEMANNVLVCGVTSPPRAMTAQIGKYRLNRAIAYEPKLLTQHAAEIYDIDFDKAAMDVHEIVGTEMREKYQVMTGSSEVKVNIVPMIKQMTFRLLLLPVYSVTLFEEDGEVRPMLVNGQTGQVVAGKAKKVK